MTAILAYAKEHNTPPTAHITRQPHTHTDSSFAMADVNFYSCFTYTLRLSSSQINTPNKYTKSMQIEPNYTHTTIT